MYMSKFYAKLRNDIQDLFWMINSSENVCMIEMEGHHEKLIS